MDANKQLIEYIQNTSGKNISKSEEEVSNQQLEKLEKISKLLENIDKTTNKTNIIAEQNTSKIEKIDNSAYQYFTQYKNTLNSKPAGVTTNGGIVNYNNITRGSIIDSRNNINAKSINEVLKNTNEMYKIQTSIGRKINEYGNKLMDVITSPIKLYQDIRQSMDNVVNFISNPFDNIKSYLNIKDKKKNDMEIAGIIKTNLNVETVKKGSAVGVALVWFNSELKKTLKTKNGIDIGKKTSDKVEESITDDVVSGLVSGGMSGSVMTAISGMSTASITGAVSAIASVAIPVVLAGILAIGFYKIVKDFFKKQEEDKLNPTLGGVYNGYGSQAHSGGKVPSSPGAPQGKIIDTSGGLGLKDKVVLGKNGKFIKEQSYSNDLLLDTLSTIRKNETSMGAAGVSIDKSKKGETGVSLGSIQWTKNRAQDYLNQIYKADPKAFEKYMGKDIIATLGQSEQWKRGKINWDEKQKANFQSLIASNKGLYSAIDEKKAKNDVAGYIAMSKKLGITDPRSIMLYSDAINQRGGTGAQKLLANGKDYDSMMMSYKQLAGGSYSRRTNELAKLKDYKLDTNKVAESVYSDIFSLTRDSMQQSFDKTKDLSYGWGSKNWKSGALDCSGFVGAVTTATMKDINKALGKDVFTKDVIKGMQTNAAGQFDNLVKHGGGEIKLSKKTKAEELKEGMILGVDARTGEGNGRYGIDHIVQVALNNKGQKVVRESEGGNRGVHETLVEDWLKKAQKYNAVYATDLYKVGNLQKENTILLANQKKSDTMLSKVQQENTNKNLTALATEVKDKNKEAQNKKIIDSLTASNNNVVQAINKQSQQQEKITNRSSNDNRKIAMNNNDMLGVSKSIMEMVFGIKIGGENRDFV